MKRVCRGSLGHHESIHKFLLTQQFNSLKLILVLIYDPLYFTIEIILSAVYLQVNIYSIRQT